MSGGPGYNRVQPESMRTPPATFAVVRILRTGRRNMPSTIPNPVIRSFGPWFSHWLGPW